METQHPENEDNVWGRYNRLMALTKDEDERGLVLAMAAFAEDTLGRLLAAYLRPGKAASELVNGFNAPLGTFSSRTKAAHAMGLISDEQYSDLELARKMRNEFAHDWEGCSFDRQNVKDWITALTPSRIMSGSIESAKEKFHSSLSCTLAELQYLISTVGVGKRTIPVIATHLSLHPIK